MSEKNFLTKALTNTVLNRRSFLKWSAALGGTAALLGGAQYGLKADCRQSNREGELIDFIHEAHAKKVAGIVFNPGGYSHTSIALHDALVAVKIPTVEVHVSNIHARESFRHHSFTARAAFATLAGFGIDGYRLAINGLATRIGAKARA